MRGGREISLPPLSTVTVMNVNPLSYRAEALLVSDEVRAPTLRRDPAHPRFSLVLSGGGAHALAHIGVLKALEHHGLFPSAVVGVSMGAIVGTVYALNPDWYDRLKGADLGVFSQPAGFPTGNLLARAQTLSTARRVAASMMRGWGVGTHTLGYEWSLLHRLTRLKHLEEARIPLAVTATDLRTGERAVLTSGDAAKAAYVSSAIPGIFPPLEWQGRLLADGGFVDNAPVDVARELLPGPVVVVDTGQSYLLPRVHNGITALYQAVQSGLSYHTSEQLRTADIVLRPAFRNPFGALHFDRKRESIASGVQAVRSSLPELKQLLCHGGTEGVRSRSSLEPTSAERR